MIWLVLSINFVALLVVSYLVILTSDMDNVEFSELNKRECRLKIQTALKYNN